MIWRSWNKFRMTRILCWLSDPLTDKLNINIFYQNFCLRYIESWKQIMRSRHIAYCYSFIFWMKITYRPAIGPFHNCSIFVSGKCLPNQRIRKGKYREWVCKSSDKVDATTIKTDNMTTFWRNKGKYLEWDNCSEIHDIWRKFFHPNFSQYTIFWSIHQENSLFWKFFCNIWDDFPPCICRKWTNRICTKKDQYRIFWLFFWPPIFENLTIFPHCYFFFTLVEFFVVSSPFITFLECMWTKIKFIFVYFRIYRLDGWVEIFKICIINPFSQRSHFRYRIFEKWHICLYKIWVWMMNECTWERSIIENRRSECVESKDKRIAIFPVWKWYSCITICHEVQKKCRGIFWMGCMYKESSQNSILYFSEEWTDALNVLGEIYIWEFNRHSFIFFEGTQDKEIELRCEYDKMPSVSLCSTFIDEYLKKWHSQYCITDSITSIDDDSFDIFKWYLRMMMNVRKKSSSE